MVTDETKMFNFEFLDKYKKFIKIFTTSLPSIFVAQNIRTLACAESVFDYAITSDVDMFPISTRIFDQILNDMRNKDNAIVIARDVLSAGQYPICYTIAKPKIWKKLTNDSTNANSIEQKLEKIYKKYIDTEQYVGEHGGNFWFVDQQFLYDSIESYIKSGGLVFKFNDSQTMHRRLDREDHKIPYNWFQLPLLFTSHFTDYHVHHPVSKNIRFIKLVLVIQKIKRFMSKIVSKQPFNFEI